MKYFYDTEFVEDGHTIDLVSIGIVSEDGREFYAHLDGYNEAKAKAHPFVSSQVLPHLSGIPKRSRKYVRDGIRDFMRGTTPDLWGYFPAWDHIALMQLWGSFTQQPHWLPMRTNDICTLAQITGRSIISQTAGNHDALEDARWTSRAFAALITPQYHCPEYVIAQVDRLADADFERWRS